MEILQQPHRLLGPPPQKFPLKSVGSSLLLILARGVCYFKRTLGQANSASFSATLFFLWSCYTTVALISLSEAGGRSLLDRAKSTGFRCLRENNLFLGAVFLFLPFGASFPHPGTLILELHLGLLGSLPLFFFVKPVMPDFYFPAFTINEQTTGIWRHIFSPKCDEQQRHCQQPFLPLFKPGLTLTKSCPRAGEVDPSPKSLRRPESLLSRPASSTRCFHPRKKPCRGPLLFSPKSPSGVFRFRQPLFSDVRGCCFFFERGFVLGRVSFVGVLKQSLSLSMPRELWGSLSSRVVLRH